MITAATRPVQRPPDAKLLVVHASGRIEHAPRSTWIDALRAGDLVVANDAATLPASLRGLHLPTGASIEVRLAGRRSLARADVHAFQAIVFGDGDFRTRTEDRPAPPVLAAGDRLGLGPLRAVVSEILGHPRLASLRFEGAADDVWAGIARYGRPIQYAHVQEPLALWDVWTVIAGRPVAFEPPSAGFLLDWSTLAALRARHIEFATLTHAAGISSAGDPVLDARLPFDEPYEIPHSTATAIRHARADRRRVVAIGTTVVRALEHAAHADGTVRPGFGLATQRVGAATRLRVVNAIVSGVHEPDTSHYQLLRAFADDETLARTLTEMAARDYRTHEFGDSVLIEATARR
jgi:S-adenosylmethionine:tRNA ribosyltransferase-isomerase